MSKKFGNGFKLLFIMKKSILNLGNPLNKIQQKQINGGIDPYLCTLNDPCYIFIGAICTDVCMHEPIGK